MCDVCVADTYAKGRGLTSLDTTNGTDPAIRSRLVLPPGGLLARPAAAAHLALDHVRLVHELAEPLVELLVELGRLSPVSLLFPAGIGALDRQIDPAVILDAHDLDLDVLPLGQVRVDILDEVAVHLADVHQSGRFRGYLDKCTEVVQSDDFTLDSAAWLYGHRAPLAGLDLTLRRAGPQSFPGRRGQGSSQRASRDGATQPDWIPAMKAITAPKPGGPEQLALVDRPDPEPGPGELLAHVRATAVNRADVLQRRGHYPPPPGVSDVLGLEMAGVVAGLGDGVTGWSIGDEVCAVLAGGGYAEQAVVPAGVAMPLPPGLDLVEAAAVPEVFTTAWDNLFNRGRLTLERV